MLIDGKQHLVEASASAKDLGRAFAESSRSISRVRDGLYSLSQATQAFTNTFTGVQQIQQAMQRFTDEYSVQEQNEKRLAEVMRERMGASDEMIKSMSRLASAQQEIGVVGDEITLQGMQQMATFLKEKQSLDVLTPAMLNLLVQQRGLNATGEDAQAIGNLLGKAMQGQVTALRRVGISFDEAQAKIMKTGTEEERAAMLAQIVTQNVGNMNAEMAKTEAGKVILSTARCTSAMRCMSIALRARVCGWRTTRYALESHCSRNRRTSTGMVVIVRL